ncbi:MAG: hypothetical protein K2X35_12035 [Bryobacteraceae bacterium]|nr:hypothetical protein [Bryobacteraceae bacterium]
MSERERIAELMARLAAGAGTGHTLADWLPRQAEQAWVSSTRESQKRQSSRVFRPTGQREKSGPAEGGVGRAIAVGLGSLFGIGPLVSGLAGLFGGGDREKDDMPALMLYSRPARVETEAGYRSADRERLVQISEGQGGRLREIGGGAGAPQITVNVQAMDSRSFLDRSHDIAQAVREAMLNSGVLSDVVREI